MIKKLLHGNGLVGWMRFGLFIGVVAGSALSAAQTESPCGQIRFEAGAIHTDHPLILTPGLSEQSMLCIKDLAQKTADQGSVRSLTVIARVGDNAGHDMVARQQLDQIVAQLAGIAVAKERISSVITRTSHGETPSVVFSYRAAKRRRAIAKVKTIQGVVSGGNEKEKLRALKRSDELFPFDYIKTDDDAFAILRIADGSELRVVPQSLIQLGAIRISAQWVREVEITVHLGSVEVVAAEAAEGSLFKVQTKYGVAGVRGTRFVVREEDGRHMRLETLSGLVELSAEKSVAVGKGYGSLVDQGGEPLQPVALPAAPVAIAPLHGPLPQDGMVRWHAIYKAQNYRLQIARDAEFTVDVRERTVETPWVKIDGDAHQGKWYWRVRAVDENGFTGFASKHYAFEN